MAFSSQQFPENTEKLPPSPGECEPGREQGDEKGREQQLKQQEQWEQRGNENEEQWLLEQTETIWALFPELWDLGFVLSKLHFWEQQ